MGSTVKTSLQFSSVSGCWMAAATLDVALFLAASMGEDGTAGIAEDTAAVAWAKKPLILSRMGTCCSATASAGRARRTADEMRIVVMWVRGWWWRGQLLWAVCLMMSTGSGCEMWGMLHVRSGRFDKERQTRSTGVYSGLNLAANGEGILEMQTIPGNRDES